MAGETQTAATAPWPARPPEPPTKPIDGPVFEERDGGFRCRVPGCSCSARAFAGRQGIANHVIRIHGLTLEGKPYAPPAPRPHAAAASFEDDYRDVNLKRLLSGTSVALVEQTIKVVEAARDNLTGKLSEMPHLERKAAKINRIVSALRELVPDGPT